MFDTDLMDILDAYEELSLLFDSLSEVKTYGVDINMSLAKADHDDYQCGLNVRIGNHLGQEYEATSKVNGEDLAEVLLTALQEMSDEFQKQADEEKAKEKTTTTTNVIESLKADNALLERRVEELHKLLEEERNRNSVKNDYENVLSNFYDMLDEFNSRYYNR